MPKAVPCAWQWRRWGQGQDAHISNALLRAVLFKLQGCSMDMATGVRRAAPVAWLRWRWGRAKGRGLLRWSRRAPPPAPGSSCRWAPGPAAMMYPDTDLVNLDVPPLSMHSDLTEPERKPQPLGKRSISTCICLLVTACMSDMGASTKRWHVHGHPSWLRVRAAWAVHGPGSEQCMNRHLVPVYLISRR